MLRDLAKSTALYGAGQLLARAFTFALLPILARAFTPSEMGIVDLVQVVAACAAVTLALEVAQGVGLFWLEARSEEARRAYVSTALSFTLCVNIGFAVLAGLFSLPIGSWLFGPEGHSGVFAVGCWAIAAGSVSTLLLVLLRFQGRPMAYILVSIASAGTTGAATAIFVAGLGWGPMGFVWGLFCGNGVGSALSLIFARAALRPVFHMERWKEMLKFSLPLVPSSVAVVACLYLDRLLLREFRTMDELGVYAVAVRVASIAGLTFSGFQSSLTPLLVERYRNPDTAEQIARVFRWFMVLAVVVFLGLSIFAFEWVYLLATDRYLAAAPLVPLLVAGAVCSNLYLFAPGPLIARRTGLIAMINGGTAILNVGLNLYLIPRIGILGASIAAAATACANGIASFALSQVYYPVPHRWSRVVIVSASAGSLVAALHWGELGAFAGFWAVIAKAGIVLAGSGAAAFLLLGRNELRSAMRLLLRAKA